MPEMTGTLAQTSGVEATSEEVRWRMEKVVQHAAATGLFIDDSAKQFNQALGHLREHGESVSRSGLEGDQEIWQVEVCGNRDRYLIHRLVAGQVVESYRPANQAEATICMTAVIQGFRPPRDLCRLDKPSD